MESNQYCSRKLCICSNGEHLRINSVFAYLFHVIDHSTIFYCLPLHLLDSVLTFMDNHYWFSAIKKFMDVAINQLSNI